MQFINATITYTVPNDCKLFAKEYVSGTTFTFETSTAMDIKEALKSKSYREIFTEVCEEYKNYKDTAAFSTKSNDVWFVIDDKLVAYICTGFCCAQTIRQSIEYTVSGIIQQSEIELKIDVQDCGYYLSGYFIEN